MMQQEYDRMLALHQETMRDMRALRAEAEEKEKGKEEALMQAQARGLGGGDAALCA